MEKKKRLMNWVRTHKVFTIVIVALLVLVVGSSMMQRLSGTDNIRLIAPDTSVPAAVRDAPSVGAKPPEKRIPIIDDAGELLKKYMNWTAARFSPQEKLDKVAKTMPQPVVILRYVKFRVIYERDSQGNPIPERNAAGDVVMWTYGRPKLKIRDVKVYSMDYLATGSSIIIYSGPDIYRSQVGPRYHTLALSAYHLVSPIAYFMRPYPSFMHDPMGRPTGYLYEMEVLYDWRILGNLGGTWIDMGLVGTETPKSDEALKRLNEAMQSLGLIAESYVQGAYSPVPVVKTNLGQMSIDIGLPPDLQKQFRSLPYKPILGEVLDKLNPQQAQIPGSAPELDLVLFEMRDTLLSEEFVFGPHLWRMTDGTAFGKSDPDNLPWGSDIWLMGYPGGDVITANAGKVNGRTNWGNFVKLSVDSTGGFSGGPVLSVDQNFKLVGILLSGLVNIYRIRVPEPELPDYYDPITGQPGTFPRHPLTLLPGVPDPGNLAWQPINVPIPGFAFMRGSDEVYQWLVKTRYGYIFKKR